MNKALFSFIRFIFVLNESVGPTNTPNHSEHELHAVLLRVWDYINYIYITLIQMNS